VCGIELEPIPGKPTARAYDVFERCFWQKNILLRTTGDILALSPPLVISKEQIEELFAKIGEALKE
jgi:beta-alanine--pyruvate transaminase